MGIVTFVESDGNCPAKFPSVSCYRSDAKTGRRVMSTSLRNRTSQVTVHALESSEGTD